MRPDEPSGPAVGRTGPEIDHRDGRIAPVAHVQVSRVRHGGVGAVPDGDRAAPRERGRFDQVHRIAQVAHRRHERPSRQQGEARDEHLCGRVGNGRGVGSPSGAEPRADQAVHAVSPRAARPQGVRAAAAAAREAEPGGAHAQDPPGGRRDRIDPHHAVFAVAVVRHEHESITGDDEIEGQGADGDLPAGGLNAPARGEERRAPDGTGNEPGPDHGEDGQRGCRQQCGSAHGPQYTYLRARA